MEQILAAASDVFVEKGMGAATMAEIAARSATHVGLLYRFFPTKEAIADALADRYIARADAATAALLERASALGLPSFGIAWLDMMLELRGERAIVLRLAEEPGLWQQREVVQDLMFQRCRDGLGTVLPSLAAPRIATIAQTMIYFGKMVVMAADGKDAGRLAAVDELRWVVSRYLAEQATRWP